MSDVAISALSALATAPNSGDLLAIVDVTDPTQSSAGSTKKITVDTFLTAPVFPTTITVTGTAIFSGAATIATSLTIGTTLGVTGISTLAGQVLIGPALTVALGDALRVRSNTAASGSVDTSRIELHVTSGQTGTHTGLDVFGYADHTTATLDTLRSLAGIALHTNAGTTSAAYGMEAGVVNSGAGIITKSAGLHINTQTNTGGGSVTTNHGLLIEDQTGAGTNRAITTGLGVVSFGDTVTGAKAITSNGVQGIGYSTGAGAVVTQLSSATTAVTINAPCGRITTVAQGLSPGTLISFTVNNTSVAATDQVYAELISGQNTLFTQIRARASGSTSFIIDVWNASTGSTENGTLVIGFTVTKGVTS